MNSKPLFIPNRHYTFALLAQDVFPLSRSSDQMEVLTRQKYWQAILQLSASVCEEELRAQKKNRTYWQCARVLIRRSTSTEQLPNILWWL